MTLFELTTAGESHGPSLTGILVGVPSGLKINKELIDTQLARRQSGYGRSARQKIEHDKVDIQGGVRHGESIGSPISLCIRNLDHKNWHEAMSVWPTDNLQGNWRDKNIHIVRPGHADLGGIARFGFNDTGLRPVLERASARETAVRVAAGTIAQILLANIGIRIRSFVSQVGSVKSSVATPDEDSALWSLLDTTKLRTIDSGVDEKMMLEVDFAQKDQDTLGGEIRTIIWGLPPGIGSYTTNTERLDGRLAQAMLSVHAMKSFSVGQEAGINSMRGSEAHDQIFPLDQNAKAKIIGSVGGNQGMGVTRKTNKAGGIEGGMSNGSPIELSVGMKPLPTLMKPLQSVNLSNGQASQAHAERSDTCAISAAAILLEAAAAMELASVIRSQFAGPTLDDLKQSFLEYCQRVKYPARGVIEL